MKTNIRLLLKTMCCFCILIIPIKLCAPEISLFNFQKMFSSWLLDPKIEISAEDFTYLISILPSVESLTENMDEPIEIVAPLIPKFEQRENTKRILLYNTHQSETYSDGVSVYEITVKFAKMLQDVGIEVVFESSNFLQVAKDEGLAYNQLYTVSRRYINEAFVNYGGFDLVMDIHRDSTTKDVSTLEKNNKKYAKMMFVVGMKSSNAAKVMDLSLAFTDKMQQILPGIMRSPFERQSIYNQDMYERMVLLELGSDTNSSEEVMNSLAILLEFFKEEYQ